MEVTRDNFIETLPLLYLAIKEADFVAVDCEFSGLSTNRDSQTDVLDSLQQRYEKLKSSAQNFMLLQFGLAAFSWSEEEKIYYVKSFNFYIFPITSSQSKSGGTRSFRKDRCFQFQMSAIEFLCSHQFDFNKCFLKGKKLHFEYPTSFSSLVTL